MSRLAAFSFESVISATAEIYAQIKKAIGTGPNTFAAITNHRSAAFKEIPAADAVPYLHIIVKPSTTYAAVVAAGLVLFGLLSPTAVTAQQSASAVTDLSVSAPATDGARHAVAARPDRNGAKPLTSHAPLACPGRSPATRKGRRSPRRSRYGAGAPAIPPGQRARSEADHLPMLIDKRGLVSCGSRLRTRLR